jgi:hypothetical protein
VQKYLVIPKKENILELSYGPFLCHIAPNGLNGLSWSSKWGLALRASMLFSNFPNLASISSQRSAMSSTVAGLPNGHENRRSHKALWIAYFKAPMCFDGAVEHTMACMPALVYSIAIDLKLSSTISDTEATLMIPELRTRITS